MSKVLSLTIDQLCFALVAESYTIGGQYLFSVVVDTIRSGHPHNWKERVTSCFEQSIGRHIDKRLQSNLPLSDFYAVCKLVRCKIDDLSERCGEKLSDPRYKERLLLQMQGVESVRHWLFHGRQAIWPSEVCTSIALLMAITQTLSAADPQPDGLCHVRPKLSCLLDNAEMLTTKADVVYALPVAAIVGALLHTGLAELTREFSRFLAPKMKRAPVEAEDPLKILCQGRKENTAGDFVGLLKQIRIAIGALPKKKRKAGGSDGTRCVCHDHKALIAECKAVTQARNKLAHGEHLSVSWVKDALSAVSSLLDTFELGCEETAFALSSLELLGDNHDVDKPRFYARRRCQEDDEPETGRRRLLRPKGQYFVGRSKEISELRSVFERKHSVLLIIGPAGIGKSYFATEVAHALSSKFTRQAWLSCSTPQQLEQDASIAALEETLFYSGEPDVNGHSSVVVVDAKNPRPTVLLVFDDVCSSTVKEVSNMIARMSCSVIITTRSHHVIRTLEEAIEHLYFLRLGPFSLAESWALVEKRINVGEIDASTMAMIEQALTGILGNLPLCISIFSYFLSFSRKCGRGVHKSLSDHLPIASSWKEIEQRFGDHLHTRGIRGIVRCAKGHLESYPLSLLLLLKLSIFEEEAVPWGALRGSKVFGLSLPAWACKGRFHRLWSGMLGLADWLFSEKGEESLVMRRSELEELGLIRWDESASTVCIHALTLQAVRDMLGANKCFLGRLIRPFTRDLLEADVRLWVSTASDCLAAEMKMSALGACCEILAHDTIEFCIHDPLASGATAFTLFACHFIQKTLENLCLRGSRNVSNAVVGTPMLWSYLAKTLTRALQYLDINCSLEEAMISTEVFYECSVSTFDDLRHFLDSVIHNAHILTNKGFYIEAYPYLRLYEEAAGGWSNAAALIHCKLANFMQEGGGPAARRQYMLDVSKRCPALMVGKSSKELLERIQQALVFGRQQVWDFGQTDLTLNLFLFLVCFRLEDSLSTEGAVDQALLKAADLLDGFLHELQVLTLGQLKREACDTLSSKLRQRMHLIRHFWAYHMEAILWDTVAKSGRVMRASAKAMLLHCEHPAQYISYAELAKRMNNDFHDDVEHFLGKFVLSSFCVGNFPFAKRVLQEFADRLRLRCLSLQGCVNSARPTENQVQRDSGRLDAAERELLAATHVAVSVFDVLEDLYEDGDVQAALKRFATLWQERISTCNSSETAEGLHAVDQLIVDHIFLLCYLKEDETGSKHPTELTDFVFGDVQDASLKECMEESFCEWFHLLDGYKVSGYWSWCLQARKEHSANGQRASDVWTSVTSPARVALMEAFKQVTYFQSKMAKAVARFIQWTFLDIAILIRTAAERQEDSAAIDRLYQSCIHCSAPWPLVSARHRLEYADFLNSSGQTAKALSQCHSVEQMLIDEFGSDYQEWLDDVPDVAARIRELV